MRLSKRRFDVSEVGLARLVRHLTTADSFEPLQVEAVGPRFHVVLTAHQLHVLETKERKAVNGMAAQVRQQLASMYKHPQLSDKYD